MTRTEHYYYDYNDEYHRHHHVRVASEGHRVTPVLWSRRMADLHNVEGMLPVSTHLLFGRPGRRFQSRPGRRPSNNRSTWSRRAWNRWPVNWSVRQLARNLKVPNRHLANCVDRLYGSKLRRAGMSHVALWWCFVNFCVIRFLFDL